MSYMALSLVRSARANAVTPASAPALARAELASAALALSNSLRSLDEPGPAGGIAAANALAFARAELAAGSGLLTAGGGRTAA